ncbi:MAG: Ribosomal RNA large subunit methyltransferase H [Myxococcota bacterium]|nr:Ribosomal RNA large subunit methyltransferase H [Myxococcota bacterium]
MKLRLLLVGRGQPGAFTAAFDDYAARIPHYTAMEIQWIRPGAKTARSARAGEETGAMQEEGERLLKAMRPPETIVVLDERGSAVSTAKIARFLEEHQRLGRDAAFVIGGAEGLAEAVRRQAHQTWSLSGCTLPHHLAHVLLLEQLYRGLTILKGEPYHK